MRKVAVCLVGVVLVLAALTSMGYAAEKFAYLDVKRAFSEYNKTKDYQKVLEEKENSYNTEREAKLSELKKLNDKLSLLSEKEKEAKREELESKAKSLQEFDRQKQLDLKKEEFEKLKELAKDIEQAAKEHAEKEGITMVFDEQSLIYKPKSMEVTDKVVEILNKSYKK